MKATQAINGLSDTKLAKYPPASELHSPWDKLVTRAFLLLLLTGILGLAAGCSLPRAGGAGTAKPSAQPRLVEQQTELQRFADDFLARGGQGLDVSAERLGTDAGREQVLRLKLVLGSSVLSIVSGANPNANLLDLVSVTVLTRLSIQDYWMHTTNGAAFQPWLDASRVLETNVWDLAARFLEPAQVAELRTGIEEWYSQTPEVRTAFFARPQAFARLLRTTQEKDAPKKSVFSLLNLDPTGELEPTVREVTESRLFAERAMYTAQRMPFFLRLQGELLAYDLMEQPTARLVFSNSMQVSEAAVSLSQTARQLPDRISAERKEIVAALESQQSKLRDLAASIDQMSSSLTITLTNAKGLVEMLTPGTNGTPFNILDYAKTADQITAMAQNLNTLISSMNQSTPEIQRLSRQASADLEKVEDRGFRLGLVLIAVLVLAGLVYTFFAEKLKRRAAAAPRA